MIITSLQEFYSFFELRKPLLAIDYGNKKIGLAISSPDHKISMPHSIITAGGDREKLQRIIDFIVKSNICAIVVGLPVNMDGTSSSQAKIVTSFVNKLAKGTNLPIYLQDERLTSRAADNMLKDMGFNRRQRNQRDDMAAASLILETVLESVKKIVI